MMDERKEEMAALYALGIMEAHEARAFEEELKTDASLRKLVDDLTHHAATLAHAAPLKEAPDPLREKVLQKIRNLEQEGEPGSANAAPAAMQGSAGTGGKVAQFKSPVPAWLPWAMAAGFAVTTAFLFQDRVKMKGEIADLRNSSDVCQMKLAILDSMNGNSDRGMAVVVWDPTTQTGVLNGEDMPRPAANEDYQLWAVDSQYSQPVNAGVINVDKEGVARVTFKPAKRVGVPKFAVSIEPKGGVTEHDKGPIIMMSK